MFSQLPDNLPETDKLCVFDMNQVTSEKNHISICICTFKRPELLVRLLNALRDQKTDKQFTYSIVVVDNDQQMSAQGSVIKFKRNNLNEISYFVEPKQNISMARNKTIENSKGNYIAIIDDDEFPPQDWLFNLYASINDLNADGILGPVKAFYEKEPPAWIVKGDFYNKIPNIQTGQVLKWSETRTSNVLIRRDIIDFDDMIFDPKYGRGGEDKEFFRRMINMGKKFYWNSEAFVYESVPPERCKRLFMIKRALLRGKVFISSEEYSIKQIILSIVAFQVYLLVLPVLVVEHHNFMKYLVKLSEHLGRLIALTGIDISKQRYVME